MIAFNNVDGESGEEEPRSGGIFIAWGVSPQE
jgi:hypothetical protein